MSNLILNLAKNSVKTIAYAPQVVKYSIRHSVVQYERSVGGRASLYSKTLMVLDGLANTPKYALKSILGADETTLYSIFFEAVYQIVGEFNPFSKVSAILHLMTPQGIYNAFGAIFQFIDRCLLLPMKIVFKKVWNFFSESTKKLLQITTHIEQQKKFIMENNIVNESLISSIWEGTKNFIKNLIGNFIDIGFKVFEWVWKYISPLIKKVYMPMAKCFSGFINGAGLGTLASLVGLWSTGATKMVKTLGVGESIAKTLQTADLAVKSAVGFIGNRFIHIFQVAGLGFINTLFLKKYSTIMKIQQYGELTDIVYRIYSFKKMMEELAMGNLDF